MLGPKPLGEPAPEWEALTPPPGVGSNHGRAKLNEVLVCDIIADATETLPDGSPRYTYAEIAAAYRLASDATVVQILSRYIWGHVEVEDRHRWVAYLLKRNERKGCHDTPE